MSDSALGSKHDSFFGAQSWLDPGARIVFETLFNMRHAGRVVDLILHEAQDYFARATSPEEAAIRARQCIELALFGAWVNYRKGEKTRSLEIEVGWDEKRLVISVSGFFDDGISSLVPSLGAPQGEASERISRFMGAIEAQATALALRHHKDIGFLQTFVILGLDPEAPREETRVIELTTPAEYAPDPAFAQAGLGLSEKLASKKPLGAAGVVEKFTADESNEEEARTVVNGERAEGGDGPIVINAKRKLAGEEALTLVPGGAPEELTETLVKGVASEADDAVTRVKGSADATSDDTIIIGGVTDNISTDDEMIKVKGDKAKETALLQKITNQKKIEVVKNQILKSNKKLSKNDEEILKVVENSTSKEAGEIANLVIETASDTAFEADAAAVTEIIKEIEISVKKVDEVVIAADTNVDRSAKEFSMQISTTQKIMEKVEMPERVKEYIADSLNKLMKNRAELDQQMKEINGKWRSAQLDFNNRQTALTTELSKREILIHQRDAALEKSKESLARTLKSMESYKQKAEEQSLTESAHKIAQAQAIATRAKESMTKVQQRYDEIQKKLSAETTARATLNIENGKLSRQISDLQKRATDTDKDKQTAKEDPAMRAELDRSNKQVEELRRQAKMLQDKLAQASNNSSGKQAASAHTSSGGNGRKEPSDAELKHKLDQSQKLHTKLKEDHEKTVKRLDEAKQTETKLRVEIAKLQAEFKAANKGGKKAS